MGEHTRTRVKALSIRGYRSVRKLELHDLELDIRPDDFAHGELPEIRIAMEVSLGARARAVASLPDNERLGAMNPGEEGAFGWSSSACLQAFFEHLSTESKAERSVAGASGS